jgi:hypothetical protein
VPRIAAGEVKSENSKKAATTKTLTDWAASVPDRSFVGVATYDADGNISLDIFLAGGNQDLVWHNDNIGHIDSKALPRTPYGQDAFGNAIEPHVVRYVGEYLGQSFAVKSASATGQDFPKRTPQARFNLLKQ